MSFDPIGFIKAKKEGRRHRPEDLHAFIEGVVDGSITDYQTSAWLMAVCFQGLSFRETVALTHAISTSGKVFEWNDDDERPVVDKHSTGGVGDTVTLVVAPLAAAMGMRMGKHSGRGLGHTGGTIDKLESIPGLRTSLDETEFRSIVNKVGCAVAGQDKDITPADGILYALRDVTATVNQEALIASSIMSKKLAGGAKYILLDVKVGSGAFMKDRKSAKSLASLMMKIGEASGRKVRSLISSMDAPLGRAIGNALEVREAIKVLKKDCPDDDPLLVLSVEIAARLASMCGQGNIRSTRSRAVNLLTSGVALQRFGEMIDLQGGDKHVVHAPDEYLPSASEVIMVRAGKSGYIGSLNALYFGELVRDLGGGRKAKGDVIDHAVGVVLEKHPGDAVMPGDVICEIHTNGALDNQTAVERANSAFTVVRRKPAIPGIFPDRITQP